ncbi:ABC transporter ATP-binding protein [Yonghaparkia sp. Soil809]|uniref:dipeptide ABC transporter ATP-binding protein n=1 Tax=Yonghaparkia sp. Soil809 TaxID=1736417 RepID=UPI0009E68945|nr:ABC transporter ATP-binding protein [Yonghaparkia sp. Soil809]
MIPLLSVRDLVTTFHTSDGPVQAVRGVSFDLSAGETLAIVGESGSGKSVTATSLMNMVRAPGRIESGSITFKGVDVLAKSRDELRQMRGAAMSMIFQDPVAALDPLMRIRDQLGEAIRAHSAISASAANARAIELMHQVGIPDPEARLRDYPLAFSGGMSQRVMIAMALANDPEVIIADEPTTALDVTVQAQILDVLDTLNRDRGTAVILITHNLGVVAQLCQRVAVMYGGKIVETGPTAEVFANPQHPYTRDLLAATPKLSQPRDVPLVAISGRPPTMREPIIGCSYAPRDPLAVARCFVDAPALEPGEGARRHACWVSDGTTPLPLRPELALEIEQAPRAAAARGAVLLQVADLTKQFDGPRTRAFGRRQQVRAVDGVTFDVHQGETLGLVGESGCGKSTIAKLVLGVESPTGGSIRYAGQDSTVLSAAARRRYNRNVQIVFQNPMSALNPRRTVGSMLSEPLALQGMRGQELRDRRDALLELVGMDASIANRFPHEFSGGQRQRLVIARALAVDPQLIVCDEAVAALDVSLQAQIINLLKELQTRLGLSYLFIGHDLATVRHIADRIMVMYLGQIVEQGTAEQVTGNPQHPYTVSLLSAVPDPDPSALSRQRVILQGEVPTPLNPPSGCRFHTRCPIGPTMRTDREICRTEKPTADPEAEHGVACHFAGEFTLVGSGSSAPISADVPHGLGPVRQTTRKTLQ